MRHNPITPLLTQDAQATGPEGVTTDQMTLTLLRYRLTHLRAVKDNGWLDLGKVTALVGVNGSGKTNLLLPVWKLNPVADGGLDPVSDYPKSLFAEIRTAAGTYRFILAEFDTGPLADDIAALAGIPAPAARRVAFGRLYDGSYTVELPDDDRQRQGAAGRVNAGSQAARTRLDAKDAPDGRVELRRTALGTVEIMLTRIESAPTVAGTTMMRPCCRGCPALSILPASGTSTRRSACHISSRTWRATILVHRNLPRRTPRMLFGFVGLQPTEILELGRDNREDA